MKRRFTPLLQYAVLLSALALGFISCGKGVQPARITFLVSGNTHGFLENCGCAGGQSGGMHRRAALLHAERERALQPRPEDKGNPADVMLLDTGNFSDGSDPRSRLRSVGVVRAMERAGYGSVGIGIWELGYEPAALYELLSQADLPYTAANLSFIAPQDGQDHSGDLARLVQPYRVETLESGYTVGVIHVIDPTEYNRGQPLNEGYKLSDPAEAAQSILDNHRREARFWVVSVSPAARYGLPNKAIADLPDVQLVFGMRGRNPNEGEHGVVFPYFIERPAAKGKDMTRVAVTFKPDNSLHIDAQKLAVREDLFDPDPEIVKLIEELKPQMEALELELAEAVERRHAEVLPAGIAKFMGHTSCNECHLDIGLQLAGTPHMHAFETLVKLEKQYADCAICHVVGHNEPGGWNMSRDMLYKDGWDRRDVQCESCHGPAEYHVELHKVGTDVPSEALNMGYNAQGLIPATRDTCIKCHDQENSPNFRFDTYWPHVQHGAGLEPLPGSPEGAGMAPSPHQHVEGRRMGTTRSTEAASWLLAQL